ncbi:MAG: cytochrome b5 domain-containing protein [Peptostreptococcaceae bacterium]|nr:cytochrome b5 domain-containing protein [Peptostreptococcaceae bacterium]
MKRKNVILIAAALVLSLSLVACGNKTEQNAEGTTPPPATENQDDKGDDKADESMEDMALEEYTLEDLAKFNGKDGMPAYIAVDGKVYDVTDHPAWKDGGHNGYEAGKDLTEALKKDSPHGAVKLEELTVVGKIIE